MPTLTFLITDLHRGGSPLLLASLAPPLAAALNAKIEVVSIAKWCRRPRRPFDKVMSPPAQ